MSAAIPIALADAAPAKPPQPYLAQKQVLFPILAAFPLITLPLAYITLFPPSPTFKWFSTAYLWAFGISHFLVTFTIYLNSKNLKHFTATPVNKLVYFGVPALIFVYFGGVSLIDPVAHPNVEIAVHAVAVIATLATYLHLGRQSFGVLQMLKGQSGLLFDPEMRRFEMSFFFVTPMLLAETSFLGNGRFPHGNMLVMATLAFAAILMLVIARYAFRAQASPALAASLAASGESHKKRVVVPLLYFLMQTGSAGLAMFDMRLYIACNAVHYTEYHALMYPRVVHSQLGDRWVDRFMGWLRKPSFLFYGVLLTGSAIAVAFFENHLGFQKLVDQGPAPFGFFFNMLNGIFLFHFFVEAFIWKFSNPYYRSALGGLYFKK